MPIRIGSAEQRVFAQSIVAAAQDSPFGRFDHQAATDKLLDLRLNLKQTANSARKPGGAFCLRPDEASKSQLCRVRQAVEILVRFGAEADGGANIGDETVGVRTIMLRDRTGIRPRSKEQLNKTMIEDVEKARKCVVLGEHIVIGLFGGRQRQRALRPQKPEIFDEHFERLVVALHHAREVRGGKIHERILPELDEIFAARRAVADARTIRECALEMTQHGEIIEPPRLRFEIAQEGHGRLGSIITASAFPCVAASA